MRQKGVNELIGGVSIRPLNKFGVFKMTFKTLTLATSVLVLSSSFAMAQGKPRCDEIANPKKGDNCEDIAALANSDGLLTGFAPIALLLLGGAAIAGGGGGTPTTATPAS
jgi:hypothetical protein